MLEDSKHIVNDETFDKSMETILATETPHVKAYLLHLTLDVEIPATLA